MLREADFTQRACKTQPMQQAEDERDDPRCALSSPGRPCPLRMISAATKTILSAMHASTGGPGTCTKPGWQRKRDAVRDCKAVIVATSCFQPFTNSTSASTKSR